MPHSPTTDGAVAIDASGRLVALSPEAASLTGLAHDAFVGQPFAALFHENDREAAEEVLRRVRSGEIDETSLRIHSASDEPVWIYLSRTRGAEGMAEDGRVTGWLHADRRRRGDLNGSAQADRLRLLATVTSQNAPFQDTIRQALRLTADLLGYDIAICSRIEGQTYTVRSCHAPEADLDAGAQFDLGETYCALTVSGSDLFEIDHMATSPHRRHPCYSAFGLESYVGIPIVVRGEVYGTLSFSSAAPRTAPLTEADDDLLRLLALWVGGAIEREDREQAYIESKRRLRALGEATFEGIFFSEHGRVLDCNEQGAHMIGFESREACIGLPLAELVPPESLAKVAEMNLANRPEPYEVVLLHRDGTRFWAEVQGRPAPYKGRTVRLTAIRDVTRRREAQEQTRFQSNVLAHVSEAVVALDAEGYVTYWNEGASVLHCLPPDAVLGKRFKDVLHYDFGPAQPEGDGTFPAQEALRQASEEAQDLTYTCPDGTRRLVSVSASTLYDAEGRENGLLAVVRDETQHRELEARLWHQANHDALTKLPNRLRLRELIGAAIEMKEPFAVLFIDLDHFKTVNDSLGHEVGDKLLEHVAVTMAAVAEPGSVSRLGGDEFAVVFPGSAPEAEAVAAALVEAVQRPVTIGPHLLTPTASVGIVLGAEDYTDPEALLRDADTAMYEAKRQGRGRSVAFEPSFHIQAAARFSLERDLRRAIAEDELRVHFQPIVDLASGELAGFESLVRWQDPVRGLLAPFHFLPLAEELGLVAEIDSWVLDATCREIGTWGADSNAFLTISVNCSDQTFLRESLAERARSAAEAAGISPDRLVLELTERALVESNAAAGALDRLRNHGLKLSIDDFGSGYSSLGLLHRLPVDALKIDRSFVSDLENSAQARAIVRAVSDLAKEIGLRVTAEGIETFAQLQAVRDAGCPLGQGYYFSRPVPPEAAARMLSQPTWQAHWPPGTRV
ncbi:EAL domain-containing protein [Rubricoccus marinus]|uniref:Diguanylate cyclase n=1 Tax=Rubricoccus marinus TaxID=716817 RepID=A0A259U242_9BACT|nr:EAL domain-containing protein [Rubricoccus marinus]OZC03874.1 hypothetical protein BSZ36_13295 [Rubricoccus marinus]